MSTNNKNKDTRILGRRKLEIKKRLRRKQWEEQEQPMLRGSNIHYEMGERNGAINCGVANIGVRLFAQYQDSTGCPRMQTPSTPQCERDNFVEVIQHNDIMKRQ